MFESLPYLLLVLLLIVIGLLAFLLKRSYKNPMEAAEGRFDTLERNQERTERLLLDELPKNREENRGARQ